MNAKRIAKRIVSTAGPCMCGAIDCPSCGPAQGYSRCDDCGEWDCECEECPECGDNNCDSDECRAMQMEPHDPV